MNEMTDLENIESLTARIRSLVERDRTVKDRVDDMITSSRIALGILEKAQAEAAQSGAFDPKLAAVIESIGTGPALVQQAAAQRQAAVSAPAPKSTNVAKPPATSTAKTGLSSVGSAALKAVAPAATALVSKAADLGKKVLSSLKFWDEDAALMLPDQTFNPNVRVSGDELIIDFDDSVPDEEKTEISFDLDVLLDKVANGVDLDDDELAMLAAIDGDAIDISLE